jgi:hypothetical protein
MIGAMILSGAPMLLGKAYNDVMPHVRQLIYCYSPSTNISPQIIPSA